MPPYNLTNISDSGNYFELTANVNDISGGYLSLFILISLFIILFMNYRGESIALKITAASFVTTIIAMLFKVINFTGDLEGSHKSKSEGIPV